MTRRLITQLRFAARRATKRITDDSPAPDKLAAGAVAVGVGGAGELDVGSLEVGCCEAGTLDVGALDVGTSTEVGAAGESALLADWLVSVATTSRNHSTPSETFAIHSAAKRVRPELMRG